MPVFFPQGIDLERRIDLNFKVGATVKRRRDYIEISKDALEKMYYEQGLKQREIAAHFGVSTKDLFLYKIRTADELPTLLWYQFIREQV